MQGEYRWKTDNSRCDTRISRERSRWKNPFPWRAVSPRTFQSTVRWQAGHPASSVAVCIVVTKYRFLSLRSLHSALVALPRQDGTLERSEFPCNGTHTHTHSRVHMFSPFTSCFAHRIRRRRVSSRASVCASINTCTPGLPSNSRNFI